MTIGKVFVLHRADNSLYPLACPIRICIPSQTTGSVKGGSVLSVHRTSGPFCTSPEAPHCRGSTFVWEHKLIVTLHFTSVAQYSVTRSPSLPLPGLQREHNGLTAHGFTLSSTLAVNGAGQGRVSSSCPAFLSQLPASIATIPSRGSPCSCWGDGEKLQVESVGLSLI